jgi:hypothetical protein
MSVRADAQVLMRYPNIAGTGFPEAVRAASR